MNLTGDKTIMEGDVGKIEDHRDVKAFVYDETSNKLKVLAQTLLPTILRYVDVPDSTAGRSVIKNMLVRGAPCIAAVGCLSLVAEMNQPQFITGEHTRVDNLILWLRQKSDDLVTARPTAVNLRKALDRLNSEAEKSKLDMDLTSERLVAKLSQVCVNSIREGEILNKRLGDFGAQELLTRSNHRGLAVLTHCNTGALATVGYGTALGVIRSLQSKGLLQDVFCTETRPYNQGSRLTAWELVREKMPATLIADSMVAYLMKSHRIDAVLVGADCVAANGDTANKIGTLQIAELASYHKVPFYVAAPSQSIDLAKKDQSDVVIEQRPADELRRLNDISLAPDEVNVWNPCFDITPGNLITGIITEFGVCRPEELVEFITSNERSDKSNLDALF